MQITFEKSTEKLLFTNITNLDYRLQYSVMNNITVETDDFIFMLPEEILTALYSVLLPYCAENFII